jgi:hypothetical protein
MFGNDPVRAVGKIQTQERHAIFIRRLYQLQSIQTGREAIDAGHDLRVGAINVRRGKARRRNGSVAKTRSHGIDPFAQAEAFVQRPAPLKAQLGMGQRMEGPANVAAVLTSRILDNGGPLRHFLRHTFDDQDDIDAFEDFDVLHSGPAHAFQD